MAFTGKVLDKKIRVNDFIGNFKMLKYVAIVIPCLYYMTYESRSPLKFSSLIWLQIELLRQHYIRTHGIEYHGGLVQI